MITRKNIFPVLSVITFGIMYLFTSVMIVIGLPFIYLRQKKIVKYMMRFWAKSIFLILGKRIQIEGLGNISRDMHFILVANHASLFDIIAVVSVFPGLSWFGHERLLRIPVFRRVLLLTDYIPMRQSTYRNTKEMIEKLKFKSADHNIAIFPEGTRTLDGKINDFYRGFILLLRASEIDVLPVSLNGFYELKPKNRSYIDFTARLRMTIHKPFKREFLIGKSDSEIAEIIRKTIESGVTNNLSSQEEEYESSNTKLIKA